MINALRLQSCKQEGVGNTYQRLVAFLLAYKVSPWGSCDETKGTSRSERAMSARSLWVCPVGTLTRHPLHKAHDRALAMSCCVSKEKPHVTLTAHSLD